MHDSCWAWLVSEQYYTHILPHILRGTRCCASPSTITVICAGRGSRPAEIPTAYQPAKLYSMYPRYSLVYFCVMYEYRRFSYVDIMSVGTGTSFHVLQYRLVNSLYILAIISTRRTIDNCQYDIRRRILWDLLQRFDQHMLNGLYQKIVHQQYFVVHELKNVILSIFSLIYCKSRNRDQLSDSVLVCDCPSHDTYIELFNSL